jgi:hypothetical protein
MIRSATILLAVALAACQPRPEIEARPTATTEAVEISSQLKASVPGVGPVDLRLVGAALHTRRGLQVIFTAKQLILVPLPNDPLGPVTAILDPDRKSLGTLSSEKYPAEHRQDFFLRIESERLGSLISSQPITVAARIASSPPTARYESVSGAVDFFRQDDPSRKTVLTVQSVVSDVQPARSQEVAITSRIATRVGGQSVSLVAVGTASHLLGGQSVIFTKKFLEARDPGPIVGPITIGLDPRRPSLGTLSSAKLPAEHRQSFYLEIRSERLGTLVADSPVVVAARIESSPPTATYKSVGSAVSFYKVGDASKKPVLVIDSVESDVTPPSQGHGSH